MIRWWRRRRYRAAMRWLIEARNFAAARIEAGDLDLDDTLYRTVVAADEVLDLHAPK